MDQNYILRINVLHLFGHPKSKNAFPITTLKRPWMDTTVTVLSKTLVISKAARIERSYVETLF